MIITHHATIYRADFVRTLTLPVAMNSNDVQDSYINRFGIEDARELIRKAYNRPVEATEQVMVVRTDFITLEAQNALLKVLEEPPLSTRFIFVIPRSFIVLPTLISRFSEEYYTEKKSNLNDNITFNTFLNERYSERILSIDNAIKKKDIDWQNLIKQGIIQYIEESSGVKGSLRELEYSVRLLLTRGASNKMLFEHVALALPIRSV